MTRYGPDTALIVVDMQNAFVHPDGALHVAGADTVLAAVNAETAAAVADGSPVLYTQDRQPIPPGRRASQRTRDVDPEWDVRPASGLRVAGPVVPKGPGAEGGFSGFVLREPGEDEPGASRLADMLREQGVERLVVAGLAADVCVKETALDARRLGYQAEVPLRATGFVHAHPDGDEAAIADLQVAGVTVDREPRPEG